MARSTAFPHFHGLLQGVSDGLRTFQRVTDPLYLVSLYHFYGEKMCMYILILEV